MLINDKKITSAIFLITKAYLLDDINTFINHYLNYCGFDAIYITDQESICGRLDSLISHPQVFISYCSDNDKNKCQWFQSTKYSEFINNYGKNYDFVLHIDDDEFLWINKNKYNNIKNFLYLLKQNKIPQFLFPWRMISYESKNRPQDRTIPLIKDCFFRYNDINEKSNIAFKSILNMKLINDINTKNNQTHFISNQKNYYTFNDFIENSFTIPFQKYELFDFILYHYRYKSYNEYKNNLCRKAISNTNYTVKDAKIIYDKYKYFRDINKYDTYINPFNY